MHNRQVFMVTKSHNVAAEDQGTLEAGSNLLRPVCAGSKCGRGVGWPGN